MKSKFYVLTTLFVIFCTIGTSAEKLPDRALWASINGASNASLGDYQQRLEERCRGMGRGREGAEREHSNGCQSCYYPHCISRKWYL